MMASAPRWIVTVATAVIALLVRPARAEPEPPMPTPTLAPAPASSAASDAPSDAPQVRALLESASRAEALRRHRRAREAAMEEDHAAADYLEALRLSQDANLRLQLALVEERRGHLAAAAEQLRQLAHAPGLRPEVARDGAARWESLVARLGQLTLTVRPGGAVVKRGRTVVGTTPLAASILLEPGAYTFQFEADGYRTKELTIEIGAGDDNERTVELYPLAPMAAAGAAPPAVSRAAEPPARRSATGLWIGAISAGALAAGGTGAGVVALRRHRLFSDEQAALDRREQARDSGRRWALASDVLFGAALAVAVGTAYYYLRYGKTVGRPRRRERGAAAGKVGLLPWASVDSAGIGLVGAL